MHTKNELEEILHIFAKQAKKLFSDKFISVILFGSYARGDYNNESDIDIMVIVDMSKLELKKYRSQIIDIITDLDWEYNVILSPIVQNYDEFEKYKNASGFFKNVLQEGVTIHA